MKIQHIVSILILIFVIPNAFAQSTEDGPQGTFGKFPENQSITIDISADGAVHVTHDVKRDQGSRYVEFVKGTVSNIEVHDTNGDDVLFGETGYGEIRGIQVFTSIPVKIQYDLDDALEFVDGIWYWDYEYVFGNAKFYFPNKVDFVYVNDRFVNLGGAKGINCHGCGLELAYYVDTKPEIKNIQWESRNIPVEIFSQNELINFSFMQPEKMIVFETENSQLVTLKIPLELLWNPYQAYFAEKNEKSPLISPQNVAECNEAEDMLTIHGTTKCYHKIFNNEIEVDDKNVLLTIHPNKSGTIVILGTSAIPEFPLFMPLVIGILLVILFQFRSKINFNFSSIP